MVHVPLGISGRAPLRQRLRAGEGVAESRFLSSFDNAGHLAHAGVVPTKIVSATDRTPRR
jgi:hypothetical protein